LASWTPGEPRWYPRRQAERERRGAELGRAASRHLRSLRPEDTARTFTLLGTRLAAPSTNGIRDRRLIAGRVVDSRVFSPGGSLLVHRGHPQRPEHGALLVLVRLHTAKDVVEDTHGIDEMRALVEHHALGTFAHRGVGDLGT